MLRIASIGECMIELSESSDAAGRMQRTFGGDTLNTAVYLARSLKDHAAEVHYVTALGDDPFSEEMVTGWQAEGVQSRLVARLPGRLPGLYIIRTDSSGERSFHYWRSAAAARDMLRDGRAETLALALAGFDLVYLSGITLGILDMESRERLFALLEALRRGGCRIAFDSNYRPRLWLDRAAAQQAMSRAHTLAAFALPTFDDEAALFGDADPAATARRLHALGVGEVVVKRGAEPCLISRQGSGQVEVPVDRPVRPVDTTAAGDSFNAAYLAARLTGAKPEAAAAAGHRLAAKVVAAQGAIVPT